MEQFVKELEMELEQALQSIQPGDEILGWEKQCVSLAKKALDKLRTRVQDHEFPTIADEIHYFKDLAPSIYGVALFYNKLFQIELERLNATREHMQIYFEQEYLKIEDFYNDHEFFCQYYYKQQTYMDEQLFTRKSWKNAIVDDIMFLMESEPCAASYWTARLRANYELRLYLDRQLDILLNSGREKITAEEDLPVLEWTDRQVDLVELAYGLHLVGCFNHGKATINQIAMVLGKVFKKDLGHFYDTFQDIARRKRDRLKFIDRVRDALDKRIDEMDE